MSLTSSAKSPEQTALVARASSWPVSGGLGAFGCSPLGRAPQATREGRDLKANPITKVLLGSRRDQRVERETFESLRRFLDRALWTWRGHSKDHLVTYYRGSH